ncbi:MAG: family 10 glycosylhydrolase [Ignavibacteria bacterium]|nr:family 10 glycosylhydrolase [Ignavibacteria bacterium]MCU7504714.1 family 10 glycosylhydrolase [Ignavibacteria bacterium]MCU7516316.1 family 10 glycosylhydrolase [Ignavibacteria bacterium]
MKKLLSVLLFSFFICISYDLSAQIQPQELRGVWITNVDSDVLTYDDATIARAMDYLASIGINVVFPVMWNNGYTLYPSGVMTKLFNRTISPKCAGRDPLNRLIIEAHRNGIEVIPWMEYGFASSYASGSINDAIIKQYPSWASRFSNGSILTDGSSPNTGFVWMSGINPEVQNFIISLCTEMLDKYDIDGIQGDDRLPALPVEGGYDSVTVSIYKAEHNGANPPLNYDDSAWKKWRADKLTGFLGRLRDSVKARDKNLILSSAPSPYYWGYNDHLQDSPTWVNNGMVDNFIPQIYPNPPARSFSEYQWILGRTMQDISQEKKNISFSGMLAKVGSYVISTTDIVNCVKENRARGIMGETYFFYEGIANQNRKNGDTLKATVYSRPAMLPYRNSRIWRPKAIVVNEDDDSLTIRVGNWKKEVSSAIGYKPNVYLTNDTSEASFTYKIDVPYDGWFGVYAYVEPNQLLSDKALYRVFSSEDSSEITVNQSSGANKGWYKLKDVYLKKGLQRVVRLENSQISGGKYILADAVMIILNRKLSPDLIITSVKDEEKGFDKAGLKSYRLENNYPNPFNPSTTIRYSIPSESNVSLKVFDLLGREVKTLVSERMPAGTHQLEFNAGNIASGVYFYRLTAEGYSETKKMILTR